MVGPSDWIQRHMDPGGAAHAVACGDAARMAQGMVPKLLRTNSLVWAHVRAGTREAAEKIVKDTLAGAHDGALLLFVLQPLPPPGGDGGASWEEIAHQRRARADPRSTMGWDGRAEAEYQRGFEARRWCDAYWVGAPTDGGGRG
eukprot:CAMPEP_0194275710 /NCGR_PEP_ID=MMETSP0169-20130528/8491_1 /TAXON_ID=218684 /ORGANISM="Corethron pennatum, Strain L29A3" /LENGTH=143 /DNA_ID=CAMNT_0039019243 /DNA_START=20 /DNA_END=451 /DNA_ORIENTATION=+